MTTYTHRQAGRREQTGTDRQKSRRKADRQAGRKAGERQADTDRQTVPVYTVLHSTQFDQDRAKVRVTQGGKGRGARSDAAQKL